MMSVSDAGDNAFYRQHKEIAMLLYTQRHLKYNVETHLIRW